MLRSARGTRALFTITVLAAVILALPTTLLAYPSMGGNCHRCHSYTELGACTTCHQNTTSSCLTCHKASDRRWLANEPSAKDVRLGKALPGYLPLNLSPTPAFGDFYALATAYKGSNHADPADPANAVVKCVSCHISFEKAHVGRGAVPTTDRCAACKTLPNPMGDKFTRFAETAHANANGLPGRYFDQTGNGITQAVAFLSPDEAGRIPAMTGTPLLLYRGNKRTAVNQRERIEECSVCHNYALELPSLTPTIASGTMPAPQTGCPACHESHIPGPKEGQAAVVDSTVRVATIAGSGTSYTVTSVVPVEGRSEYYVNPRPFKVRDGGAQDVKNGTWARGSLIAPPRTDIVAGTGTISDVSPAKSVRLTFPGGGFSGKVKRLDTLFISGQTAATVDFPANADPVLIGQQLTLQATLDKAGFEVEAVVDDNTLDILPRTNADAVAQLGTDTIGVVAKTTVTYIKNDGKKGSLVVFVPFSGEVTFSVRTMMTNSEALCSSCHAQGSMKFSVWGKRSDGTFVDVSASHAANIGAQYRNSGHGRGGAELPEAEFPAFDEFSAFAYDLGHQAVYPFDMSLTGPTSPPQVDQLANKGNTTFALTTPNAAKAYLAQVNNTSLPVMLNNYSCNQCHHGLAAVDYLNDVQGTTAASILWGDATVTCITCHSSHLQGGGSNVRQPVMLSFNSRFSDSIDNPRGGLNAFMDGTEIPANIGTSLICAFCHQGRESGLTMYLNILQTKGVDLYTADQGAQIDPTNGVSTINPHYFDEAAQLWSRNAWEFIFDGGTNPQKYSTGILQHQLWNCTGCHMPEGNAAATEGGHTWKPRIETCRLCHGPTLTEFEQVPALVNYDGGADTVTTVEKLGTIADDGSTGSGLVWLLAQQLDAQGIVFKPASHPYFYEKATGAQYKKYTPPQLQAAFNLLSAFKAGKGMYYHNAFYVAQILQDSIVALGGTLPADAVRPPGSRPATDYRNIVVNP